MSSLGESEMRPPPGLLLLAHGARDPLWARPFEAVAARCRAAPDAPVVVLAYLEFMAPDLPGAARQLAQAGCRQVAVLPLFLGAGGHVRKDVPGLMEAARAAHPELVFALQPSVGEAPNVIEAMAQVGWQAAAHICQASAP